MDNIEVEEKSGQVEIDLPPPKKKAGRKKVAQRKKVRRPKGGGKITKSSDSVCDGDEDLAECLFSDDELREAYLAENAHDGSESQMSLESSEAGTSMDTTSNLSSESIQSSLFADSDSSRPCSALSRPASVADLSVPEDLVQPENLKSEDEVNVSMEPSVTLSVCPSVDLIQSGLEKFREILIKPWIPIADRDGFHLLLVSRGTPKAIQREIFISYSGNVQILMHCKTLPNFKDIFKSCLQSVVPFSEKSVDQYCVSGLNLVQTFLQFEACIGANDLESRIVWEKVQGGEVDRNPYHEDKYSETYRSVSCLRIIPLGKGKRCSECSKLMKSILQRKGFLLTETAAPFTKNQNLTLQQAIHKLESQQEELRKRDKKIAYLQDRVNLLIESEGVNIDEDLNETFSRILMGSDKLTEAQKMFIQEQWSQAHASDSRVHRWHPAMIRLALHMHMSSSGTYESVRDLGFIKLPHSRTLFDYSHSIQAKDGINEGLVKLVAERVQELKEPHKEFHVVMFDGIHVSQNLVFRVSDGELVGFANIDEVEKEMERLDKFTKGEDPICSDPPLATEVLAFLVKGMASDVKCVIASYPMKVMSKEILYKRTWDVIRHLENAGVKVLALICDGHPVNRAFFNMHTPHTTKTIFGAIFDTINFCAPDRRLIFFISDLCHLLKTIRNAFHNSGTGPKKPRLLQIHGQTIEWKTIVKLYYTFKNHNFRKSYKLNAQNVFPNSYSRMKVRYAAHPLSNTVGQDIEDQKWPGTEETVRFIRFIDRFFDCLNGAHTGVAKRKNKPDLAPYTVENIDYEIKEGRFKFLHDFLQYLLEWKQEVDRMPLKQERKQLMMLPQQTLVGIETTIKGTEAATVFFLDQQKCGGKFVNARIFSQDPLEQHFSKQRSRGGGSRNPNVAQFQQGQVATALQRGLGFKRRKGNSAEEAVGMQVINEPVPKKARYSRKGK